MDIRTSGNLHISDTSKSLLRRLLDLDTAEQKKGRARRAALRGSPEVATVMRPPPGHALPMATRTADLNRAHREKMNYSETPGMTWTKRRSTGTSVAAVIHHGVPQTERDGLQRHHRTIVYRISGLHTF
jgi:hypothetical protein